MDLLHCFAPWVILFSRSLDSASDVLLSHWLGELREKENTYTCTQQRHIAEQLFDRPVRTGGIAAAEVVFRVKYYWRLAPDQGFLMTNFQRLFSLNGVIRTCRWTVFPIRFVGRRCI